MTGGARGGERQLRQAAEATSHWRRNDANAAGGEPEHLRDEVLHTFADAGDKALREVFAHLKRDRFGRHAVCARSSISRGVPRPSSVET